MNDEDECPWCGGTPTSFSGRGGALVVGTCDCEPSDEDLELPGCEPDAPYVEPNTFNQG